VNEEREATKLAEAYIKLFLGKFRYRLFSLKTLKESKWWSSFFKAASSFSQEEEWDPYKYTSYLFGIIDKPFPFMYVYGKNWTGYTDYIRSRTKGDASVAKSLLTTYIEIRDWSKKETYDIIAVEAFFTVPNNFMFLKRGKYSPYFLSISRSFMRIYNSLTEKEKNSIISQDDLIIKRRTVLNNKKISQKLCEILGEEYIGFN
jgi:hypothetical protein